ncbi:cupin domain-containing protein [Gilliamella sp. B2717]|uniref:cupin domain-containing protein n=1 Tax=Gilliamella sp. B2717 TaxID=2817996 RepID=UPI00226A43AB|nr:cupin domain-containing protein [Gilliamella sp. B2717]MCX8578168.1 cupin domain-containing protein [Gilliamella sp. B2717]
MTLPFKIDQLPEILPRLLIGTLRERLRKEDIKFEPIVTNGRANAEVHWLFKGEESNGASGAIIRYNKGGYSPLHLHTGFELKYILEGEMHTSMGTVKKNDLILLRPGSVHESWASDIGCISLIIWLEPVKKID